MIKWGRLNFALSQSESLDLNILLVTSDYYNVKETNLLNKLTGRVGWNATTDFYCDKRLSDKT